MSIKRSNVDAITSWVDLLDWAQANDCRDHAEILQGKLKIEDAQFLLRQLARIEPPERIHELTTYQRWQEELGGSFHGMLPEQLVDAELLVPRDLPSCLRVAHQLADVRAANDAALREINPSYAIAFRGEPFPSLDSAPSPERWAMALDVSGLRALLTFLAKEEPSENGARTIASMHPFQEMMTHRRNLGYIPEPLIDTDGLAAFIQHVASDDPLDRIWAWLNSQNFFDLADIVQHRGEYERLIGELESRAAEIEGHILGTIVPYAPESMRSDAFRDRISFTVGWGIAGWATANTAGINIEQFKDDYERLLTTLTHESVHRWQLRIGHPDGQQACSFEDLTAFPFEDERDRSFYTALSYVMLEGTATYIAPSHAPPDRQASVEQGAELLVQCHRAIYENDDLGKAADLVNEGLRSNGPFYWLGEALTRAIVETYGSQTVGETLRRGGPCFVNRGLEAASDTHWARLLSDETRDRIHLLEAELTPHDGR